jgi:hypothetical protein
MQPCPTCGGMGIDANGHCTQCRTYRGVPQVPPPHGAPHGGMPGPYAGYPTSPGPAHPQPTSGGAPMAYPATTYGGAYGAPTGPPPPKGRNSFLMPVLALSATLIVLVVAIVIVVVVKNSGGTATGAASNSTKALVDECVVGSWEMTSYNEDVPTQVGTVPLALAGKGAAMRFSKDGRGVQDFGTGTQFSGTVTASGQNAKVNLEIKGTVRYDFRTNDGVMSFSNLQSDGKATVYTPLTGQSTTQDFKGSSDPSKYTCSGDKMTMSTSAYQSELKRT